MGSSYQHRYPEFGEGNHLPVLIRCLLLTDGPVLEMGMGISSSPAMHWLCAPRKRELVSYESNKRWFDFAKDFEDDFHRVFCIEDWNTAEIERPWDVVLVDHEPSRRRSIDIMRLANHAKYIVIHDSQGRSNHYTHFDRIWPLFKWQYNYDVFETKTTVVSNLVDLTNFQV